MDMVCEYCGRIGFFDVEEDTGKLYCMECGHYVEIEIYVDEVE